MTTEPNPYTSNTTPAEAAGRLAAASRVALLTHAKPDGDAVGSAMGLARALAMGQRNIPSVTVFCPPWDGRFDALLGDTPVVFAEVPTVFDTPAVREADLVAVLDTGSFAQLGPAADFVRERHDQTLIIDHHAGGDPTVAPLRLIDTAAASATQVVARVACALLGAASPADLPAPVAEPLYFGLATDTGWFRHPSVNPDVFRLAADLLSTGVDHNQLYTASEMSDPPERLLLIQRALASLELIADRRAAVVALGPDDFDQSGATFNHASGLVDIAKGVTTVEVSAMLYEVEPGRTKVSLRSKASDLSIDVNAVASTWGGGGHKHAAGAKINKPLAEARAEVERAVASAIDNATAAAPVATR